MPHTRVIEQLKQNLQTAYRQAIDADAKLDELKKAGHGKFASIFGKQQGFSTESNRFGPYVQELAQQLTEISADNANINEQIEQFVPKLAVLLQTLQAFKNQAK
ncbi:prephenate dehydrogenase [Shewanella sp. Scap07]|uniref:prephenate dehydrogenase n=1 Tax=Shewanella sp. Scap07 TaxID=2589987 RepID=UPI0015B9CFDF|nr:prephenate dehydrogenase [Shewanella sp. Scap07]QLE87045.1 prephenate dehydrogenase [Shewanella sp. Scap07]